METVDLPLVLVDSTLRDAFQLMESAERSGFVAVLDNQVWLYKAGEVVLSISEGKQTVRDLDKKLPVGVASEVQVTRADLDWLNPHHTYQAFESLLESINHSYLMMRLPGTRDSGTMVRIITRYETLGYELNSGPVQCYCTNVNSGPHECRRMPPDRRCVICGQPIRCI
jgi:hypothetical protein